MTNISKVTLDSVLTAARENIQLDNLVITVVGNKNKIEEQLNRFNSFPIEIKERN